MELIERLALPETNVVEGVLPESTVEDDAEFIVPIGLDTVLDADAALDPESMLDSPQNSNSTLDLESQGQCDPALDQALDDRECYPTT